MFLTCLGARGCIEGTPGGVCSCSGSHGGRWTGGSRYEDIEHGAIGARSALKDCGAGAGTDQGEACTSPQCGYVVGPRGECGELGGARVYACSVLGHLALLALKVFRVEEMSRAPRSAHLLRCGGGTDNRSTGQLVKRRLSTKWPVMILLLDYLAYCEEIGVRCELDWRPRDANVEADQLTNSDFSAFSIERRIKVEWEDLSFPIVDLLMKYSESFSKRKHEVLDGGAAGRGSKFTKSTWG